MVNYHHLKANWHRDPFDKMLIWQAIKKDITLISKEEDINKYRSAGLKVVGNYCSFTTRLLVIADHKLKTYFDFRLPPFFH